MFQIYSNLPYFRMLFLGFTVLFHVYLLVRASVEGRYAVAAVLMIPVAAISIALWKFAGKAVIRVRVSETEVEIGTLLKTEKFKPGELSVGKRDIKISDGRMFLINRSKALILSERLSN